MSPFMPDQAIVRCPRCELCFYEGEADPATIYKRNYFVDGEYANYEADKPVLQMNFRRRIARLRRLLPGTAGAVPGAGAEQGQNGRLLEIGSAYGFFLEIAAEHWQVRGLDVAADAVEHAHTAMGLDVTCCDFLDLPDEAEAYDIVCLWDTIEHLTHPVRVIEKAARWLKPGGLLALTTGDIGSPMARLRGQRWRLIHPPPICFTSQKRPWPKPPRRRGWKSWKSPTPATSAITAPWSTA